MFLPLPLFAGKISYLPMSDFDKVLDLTLLSSPTRTPIFPTWRMTPAELRVQSRLTNVQPLVITQATVKWMADNTQLIESFSYDATRPLIILGEDDAVVTGRVKRGSLDDLEIQGELKDVGAMALRSYMRGE